MVATTTSWSRSRECVRRIERVGKRGRQWGSMGALGEQRLLPRSTRGLRRDARCPPHRGRRRANHSHVVTDRELVPFRQGEACGLAPSGSTRWGDGSRLRKSRSMVSSRLSAVRQLAGGARVQLRGRAEGKRLRSVLRRCWCGGLVVRGRLDERIEQVRVAVPVVVRLCTEWVYRWTRRGLVGYPDRGRRRRLVRWPPRVWTGERGSPRTHCRPSLDGQHCLAAKQNGYPPSVDLLLGGRLGRLTAPSRLLGRGGRRGLARLACGASRSWFGSRRLAVSVDRVCLGRRWLGRPLLLALLCRLRGP